MRNPWKAGILMPIAYFALGSNLGNREANLSMAVRAMARLSRVVDVSSVYKTGPEGPAQPDFYNAVVRVETGLEPRPLLRFIKAIEEEMGRRPGGVPKGPRPIDIDILLYGDWMGESPDLTVPHPRLAERSFVLIPLAEIASEIEHPILRKTLGALAESTRHAGVSKLKERGWDGIADRTDQRIRI